MHKEIIGNCELYLGDCRGILPSLSDIDAVVTDPPYGIQNHNPDRRKAVRKSRSNLTAASNAYEIIGDDGPFDPSHLLNFPVCVLWGANNFVNILPPSRQWFIWDKRCGATSDDQSDCEIGWSSFNGPARVFSHKWRGMIKDSEKGEKRLHPTQKPVALMEWCIKSVRKKPGVILDPYMGSGTTGLAARKLGHRFVGIEIDAKFFDVACRRISESTGGELPFEGCGEN